MWVPNAAMATVFMLLGVLFSRGKGAFLIAGYNTASAAERARYDEKALCRFLGKLMFALAACQALMGLGAAWAGMWLYWLGIGLFLASVLGGVIYANTGGRFLKRTKEK